VSAPSLIQPTLRERRNDKRKQEILEAALAIMTEDGYGNASMDRIAAAALLTRVGLYRHFKDKAALVTALRAHKLLELSERVKAAVQLESDFEARVTAVIRATFSYQTQNEGFFRILFASSFSHELAADTSLKPFLYVVAAVFEDVPLAERRDLGAIDCAGLLAMLAFGPSVKRAFVPSDAASTPHAAELVAGVFLHGILRSS